MREMNQSPPETPLTGAEHRLVTILFVDIVGSTALTGEVEAEMSRLIFDRCLRIMSQSIDEFGGTVARLMGDGLLAFFGAPISYEDDPERAALAALDIHDAVIRYGKELDISLQVRIGINTGRVVMGEMGGEVLSEYTAIGHPIVMAERLQSSAEPGTTLLGETTCRLVAHRFETQAISPLKLKGFDERVPAFLLIKQRERTETARGIPGTTSPLIGREKELEKLVTLLDELQSGRGAITALIGEPGVGKSRLLHEAHQKVINEPITCAQGQASSYTAGQPFSVIRDLLGELLNIGALDTPAMIDLKIERELSPLFDQRLGEIWPPIALLLGAPVPPEYADQLEGLEPEALNRRLTSAFCNLVEALAGNQPMVLGFDDLHWADPSSLNLLEALFLVTERAPLLIALLFRPDHESRIWELKGLAERDFGHRYLGFSLDALTQSESRTLTTQLLSNENVPERVHELLLEKSEGNPFFLEELLQDLMESGTFEQVGETWELSREIQQLRVPETLQEVIQARVDRLPTSERLTLQSAAVIGKRFGLHLLEAVTPRSDDLPSQLLTIQRADLIREWSRQPEPIYDFKQSAVQEVTYQQLLAEQRRDLHQKVAQSLEGMFAELLDEHAAMLAHHFSLAGDNLKAFMYHRMAGDKAFRLSANLEAAEHYSQAIELAQDQDDASMEDLSHLYLSLGRVHEHLAQYDQALDVYDELRELADHRGEPTLGLRARLAKNTLRVTPTPLFDAEVGRRMSEEALELARSLNDPQAEAKTLWHLGLLGRLTAHDAEAIQMFEQSLAIAEAHELEEQIGYTLTDLYWSYLALNHVDVSRKTIERAHEMWTKLENLPMIVDTLAGKVFVQFLAGEYHQAIETAQKALALSENIDNLWGKSYSQAYSGFVHIDLGEIDRAFETMQRSIELGIKAGFFVPGVILPAMRALTRARLGGGSSDELLVSETTPENFRQVVAPVLNLVKAEIHATRNELDQANKLLDESQDQVAPMSTMYLVFPPELARASYCHAVGQHDKVVEITTDAIKQLSERGIVCRVPQFQCLRAKAFYHLGNQAAAMEALNQGLALTTQSGARWAAWQLLALRAQLRHEAGEDERAADDLHSAAEMVNFIAGHIGEDELHESFLGIPEVAAILDGRYLP
jgi:class 3 adenylate cyclase/tetratricopeptide (TPR) repeat protein